MSMFAAPASLASLCPFVDSLPMHASCCSTCQPDLALQTLSIVQVWGFALQSRCCLHSSSNLVVVAGLPGWTRALAVHVHMYYIYIYIHVYMLRQLPQAMDQQFFDQFQCIKQ